MIRPWTIHPIIQEDESLSSWIKRLADAYTASSLPNVLNTDTLRYINPDIIDRNPRNDLIDFLSEKTGICTEEIKKHTLAFYDTHFPIWKGVRNKNHTGLIGSYTFTQNFILSLRRPYEKDGIRYCPLCLKEKTPYFRFYWLLGYYTACLKHKILLYSQCTRCQKPIKLFSVTTPLGICHNCRAKLDEADPIIIDTEITQIIHSAFLEMKSPLPFISSQQLLGHIWRTYSKLMLLEQDYLEQIFIKYNFKTAFNDINPVLLSHCVLQLVWKIIQQRSYDRLDKLLPCIKCDQYFDDNNRLLRHYARHFEPSIECTICKEKFFKKFEHDRHQIVHSEKNEFCPYCPAYFTRMPHVSLHISKMHEEQLKKDMNNTIIQLKSQKQEITYDSVADALHITKALLKSKKIRITYINAVDPQHTNWRLLKRNRKISNFNQVENDLYACFLKVMKLPMEERKKNINEIILEAINRIQKRNEKVTQISVAKEIGINRIIFFKNSEYKNIVNEYRTGKGGYNTEYLIMRVEKAIITLKQQGKTITYRNIAKEIRCDIETLTKRSEIQKLIDPHRDIPKEKPTIEKVKNIVEGLKKTHVMLTKTIMQNTLQSDYRTLQKNSQIFSYIEQEIEEQQRELKKIFQDKLKKILDIKFKADIKITFRGIAKELSVDAHKLLNDNDHKSLIEHYIEQQKNKKRQIILSVIHALKLEQKQITCIEVHKKTKLPKVLIHSVIYAFREGKIS